MANKTKIWLQAIRPKTLSASVVPVYVGACMVKGFSGMFSFTLVIILLTALAIQITCNLVNDLFDYRLGADNHNRKGPTRVMQAGLVNSDEIEKAIVISTIIALILGYYLVKLGGLPILVIGLLSILFAFTYTAGKLPLAYLGLGDIFVLIFFGPVAVGGTVHLMGGEINTAVILNGLALGAISSAILTVNNLRDLETDALANKKTLVVRFGKFFAKWQYTALLLIPVFTSSYLTLTNKAPGLIIFSALYFIFAIKTIKNVLSEKELNSTLAQTAKMLIIFGSALCFGYFWAA